MNILRGLNDEQTMAVLHHTGPILVLAGPGTGKTRVITHRIAYLIKRFNVPPERILAVTFTNKAAQEMRSRVSVLLEAAVDVWIGTFHATCVRILREHGNEIGLNPNFAIFDQETQNEVIVESVRDLSMNPEIYPVWYLRDIISAMKIRLDNPDNAHDYIRTREGDVIIDPDEQEEIVNLLKKYQEKLSEYNALDFDDLILNAVKLLGQKGDVSEQYQRRIRYILVDEFQDINFAQYEFLRLICNPEKNIMAVADDDQTIYSWRGSDPAFIDKFKTDFGDRVIMLKEHYRSTKKILIAAQELIKNNPRQKGESVLETENALGYNLVCYHLDFPDDELKIVSTLIGKLVTERRYSYGDIAIFYRTHRLGERLEEHLLRQNIGVQRIRQLSSFHDENVRNIVAYLRYAQWHYDKELKLAMNFPQVLIDEVTMVKLEWLAQKANTTLEELLKNIDDYRKEIGPLTRRNIKRFFTRFGEFLEDINGSRITNIVLDLFKLLEAERSPYSSEDIELLEIAKEVRWLTNATDTLYRAIDIKEPIHITATYGIDNYCAARIIVETLEDYLDVKPELNFLPADDGTVDDYDEGVHILIGSYDTVPAGGAMKIVIGDVASSEDSVIQLCAPENEITVASKEKGEGQASPSFFALSPIALKLCQRLLGYFEKTNLDGFVVYDLETLTNEPKSAEIIEIAASLLNAEGQGYKHFHQLVKPKRPIPRGSTRIHGIDDKTVENAPPIEEVLPQFLDFIGDRILVGHNIEEFDNRVIDREMSNYSRRGLSNPFYDTCITAKRLYPRENYKLEVLADKFGIEHEILHRALEDVEVTRQVFERLSKEDWRRREQISLPEMSCYVALSLLDKGIPMNDEREEQTLYNAAVRYIVHHQVPLDWLTEKLQPTDNERVDQFMRQLRKANAPESRDDTLWRNLKSNFMNNVVAYESNSLCLERVYTVVRDKSQRKDFADFLDYQSLVHNIDEMESDEGKVAMMTLHSAKGTEFPVVIMIGMEERTFPIYRSDQPPEMLEEERRLCYVGMTRAKERLYLTSVSRRTSDIERGSSMFIREIPSNLVRHWTQRNRS